MTPDSLPPPVMLLNVGKSGGGKTGALLSLARRGFTLRIADFDNAAAQVFRGIMYGANGQLRAEYQGVPERIDIVPFTDKLKSIGGKLKVATFDSAWERFLKALDAWPVSDVPSTGGLFTWGPETIFVVDTLTALSNASMRFVMKLNGKEGDNPSQPNWGDAMRGVEDFLSLMRFGPTRCHCIVNAHIQFLEGEEGLAEGLPLTLGNKLAPKIPPIFPVMVRTRNNKTARVIQTAGDSRMELKVPAPDLDKELPQDTGLATIFSRLGWARPPAAEEKPA